jgi:hypothetical protein
MLEHNTARNIELLEGIPSFAKIFVPSLNNGDVSLVLPAYFTISNMGSVSDF